MQRTSFVPFRLWKECLNRQTRAINNSFGRNITNTYHMFMYVQQPVSRWLVIFYCHPDRQTIGLAIKINITHVCWRLISVGAAGKTTAIKIVFAFVPTFRRPLLRKDRRLCICRAPVWGALCLYIHWDDVLGAKPRGEFLCWTIFLFTAGLLELFAYLQATAIFAFYTKISRTKKNYSNRHNKRDFYSFSKEIYIKQTHIQSSRTTESIAKNELCCGLDSYQIHLFIYNFICSIPSIAFKIC